MRQLRWKVITLFGSVIVYQCPVCGSLVMDPMRTDHEEFHTSITFLYRQLRPGDEE